MNFIDIHTHSIYHDPEVTLVLNVFPDEILKAEQEVYCSVGLHPWHIQAGNWESMVEKVRIAARKKNVLAIGETGLDKKTGCPFELQQLAFAGQLAIAESVRKAVIIHCVRSYNELLAVRKKSSPSLPWIFHWFNADDRIAETLIRHNCYLSFGHMLFREESKAFRVFRSLPVERIFFETDDSGYGIREIYSRAAVLRNTTVNELKSRIMDNFGRCFQL